MKGRVVFHGNQVTSQSWDAAIFQDLGSSPATMEASRVADMWGCCPGHGSMQADTHQAYSQAELLGTETCVCLLPEARPKAWRGKYIFPFVCLRRPYAGTQMQAHIWKHCNEEVIEIGWGRHQNGQVASLTKA